eukprot:TRINITY_DN7002_c0_g7_i1.p1 TRINITY_DN7002_c0_g7~~TRINITY_DN7002_c0_g7_i1.p1  ORF type:complete len:336 (+),score=57.82 TRINITY_DN7002_c0_g7_i1:342-1349(+)
MQSELNNPKVAQTLLAIEKWGCNASVIKEFNGCKEQVLSGALEARTNYEILKEIERPFATLVGVNGLTSAPLLFPSMMATLQTLYKKSSFYKESRLLSFMEKLVAEILRAVERAVVIKDFFDSLYKSKDSERKVAIKLSQANMVIDVMIKNLFIRDWLSGRNTLAGSANSDEDISYLKFSRPGTAYVHDSLPQRGDYVEMTNRKLPPHMKVRERLGEKNMWFERAQMLINALEYSKKAVMNIEAMCKSFVKVSELAAGLDAKSKLCSDVNEFFRMYIEHDLGYAPLELPSAEAFESFVVHLITIDRRHTRGERRKYCSSWLRQRRRRTRSTRCRR